MFGQVIPKTNTAGLNTPIKKTVEITIVTGLKRASGKTSKVNFGRLVVVQKKINPELAIFELFL